MTLTCHRQCAHSRKCRARPLKEGRLCVRVVILTSSRVHNASVLASLWAARAFQTELGIDQRSRYASVYLSAPSPQLALRRGLIVRVHNGHDKIRAQRMIPSARFEYGLCGPCMEWNVSRERQRKVPFFKVFDLSYFGRARSYSKAAHTLQLQP